ncbi:hypothetical protein BGZ70_004831 [Mortierella alpina]|uniref:Uncharacterized protein n=1 Tax=Mortierella alpina TaxID=64518 RepID=A0A9P6JA89_MORAP|nr:hypothetical protein BGZ70_004831 [Mortierella alpina]
MRPPKRPWVRSVFLSVLIAHSITLSVSARPIIPSSQQGSPVEKRAPADETTIHREPHTPYKGPNPPGGTLTTDSVSDPTEKRSFEKRGLFSGVLQDQDQGYKNTARARSSDPQAERPKQWGYDDLSDEIMEEDEDDDGDYWGEENEVDGLEGEDRMLIEPMFPSRDLFEDLEEDENDGASDEIGIAYDEEEESEMDDYYWNAYRRRQPRPGVHSPSPPQSREERREHERTLLSPVWAVDEWDEDLDTVVEEAMDELMDWVQDVDHGQAVDTKHTPSRASKSSSGSVWTGWSSGWALGKGSNKLKQHESGSVAPESAKDTSPHRRPFSYPWQF